MPTANRAVNALIDVVVVAVMSFALIVTMSVHTSVRPKKSVSTITPKNFGLNYVPVRLTTSDGLLIAGWYIPKKTGETRSTVVALHGYPADKADILPHVLFLADKFNLLLIDFRYFGESGGRMSTVGAKEGEELAAALRYLKSRDMEKIGVYGFSMGGSVALMALEREADVAAVVAEAAYSDLEGMVGELFRRFGPARGLFVEAAALLARTVYGVDIRSISPARAVAGSRKPVLLIHSRGDQVIDFGNAEAIQSSLAGNPNAEFWFPDAGGHGMPVPQFNERVSDFFERYLE